MIIKRNAPAPSAIPMIAPLLSVVQLDVFSSLFSMDGALLGDRLTETCVFDVVGCKEGEADGFTLEEGPTLATTEGVKDGLRVGYVDGCILKLGIEDSRTEGGADGSVDWAFERLQSKDTLVRIARNRDFKSMLTSISLLGWRFVYRLYTS